VSSSELACIRNTLLQTVAESVSTTHFNNRRPEKEKKNTTQKPQKKTNKQKRITRICHRNDPQDNKRGNRCYIAACQSYIATSPTAAHRPTIIDFHSIILRFEEKPT
jgi:hypothetical protein